MRRGLGLAILGIAGLLSGCETTVNDNTATTNANLNSNANVVVRASPSPSVRHNDDTAFANNVALDGMAEVELGRLAGTKSKNAEVKSFAQRMVTDHSKANAELKQLATTKNLTLPAAVGPAQQADKDRLSKLNGAEFDREYMSMMAAAHDKAVAAFEDESTGGTDADIRSWATKILPTLKEHQSMAKDLAAKLNQ